MHPDLKGFWQFFGRIDVGEGWFFHAPVPKDTTRSNYDFKGLVQRAAGFEFACDFDHVGFWDMRVAVAERYQVGRVFIAGDAAHSHPPYGGFGLNNGLEDAVNLGWKLAATLQGWGGEGLLPTYSEERRVIFKETGSDFIASRIEADRVFLERYSPERDKAEFEKADINPGMRPEVIRTNIERQAAILRSALDRRAGSLVTDGYRRGAIEEAMGRPIASGSQPAPAPQTPDVTATNPQTGQRMRLDRATNQWVPF